MLRGLGRFGLALCLIVGALACNDAPASAQTSCGVLQPGQVCGNSGTVPAPGAPVGLFGAVAPVGGLPLYAAPSATGSGNCLSSGNACTLATACSFVKQIATFLGSAGPLYLADGTYSTAVNGALCTINGNAGGNSDQLISIVGDVVTPTNVVLAVPNNAVGILAQDGGEVGINSLEFTGGNNSVGIQSRQGAVSDYSFVSWGGWGTGGSHLSVNQNGNANLLNTETILANFSNHWTIQSGGQFNAGAATAIPSAVSWSGEFLGAIGNVYVDLSAWSATGSGVSGSTGVRASLQGPGYLAVAGACATVIPGTPAGGCSYGLGFQDSQGGGMTGTGVLVGQFEPMIDGPIVAPRTFAGLAALSPTQGQLSLIVDGKNSNCGDGNCTTQGTGVTGGGGSLVLLLYYDTVATSWRLWAGPGPPQMAALQGYGSGVASALGNGANTAGGIQTESRQVIAFMFNSTVAASATDYCWNQGCGGTQLPAIFALSGTLKNFTFSVTTAPGTGQTFTLTVYYGTAAGSLTATSITCQIAGSATTCQDATHTKAVAANSFVTVQIVASSGATSTVGGSLGIEFDNP
jgi:hypothetical protein